MPALTATKTKTPFEISGTFTSVVEWRKGLPRRVELVQGNNRVVLKLAKDLRNRFAELSPGADLTLHGVVKTEGDRVKRKVTGLGPVAASPLLSSELVIQVCGKKNCWDQGGSDVYAALQNRIAEEGMTHVRLERSGCLGNCRQCPSARLAHSDVTLGHLSGRDIKQLLPHPPVH